MSAKRKLAADGKTPPSKGRPGLKPKEEPTLELDAVTVETPPAPALGPTVETALAHAPAAAVETPPAPPSSSMVLELARGADAVSATEEEVVRLVDTDLPKTLLRCDVCHSSVKPPVYQCSLMRHVACGDCGAGECRPCADLGDAAIYMQSSFLDTLFGYIKVPCPYSKFGCASSVVYGEVAAHAAACACAPCACPKCSFEGSPAELVRHLTDEAGKHAWPVRNIAYGSDQVFTVDMRELYQEDACGVMVDLFLLVAEDDGVVFLLAIGDYDDGTYYVIILCVRSSTVTAPVYSSSVVVSGPPATVRREKMEKKAVANCSVPAQFDVDEEPQCNTVMVFPEDLHDGNEMHLFVCINKI